MQYDVIEISEEELSQLSTIQIRLLRTAQQKKDEMCRNAERDKQLFYRIALTNGIFNSSIVAAKNKEIDDELYMQLKILKDNLIYNMTLSEPSGGDDLGEDPDVGYIVDYSLSYNERFIIVRDYYLKISDPVERLNLYRADETARKYLSTYYTALYDYFYSLTL